MAFKRVEFAPRLPIGEGLTKAMAGIGMNFATSPAENPNIEDTLLAASREGMDRDDLRVLSILVNWLSVHYRRINVDRLIRAVSVEESPRVRAFWCAIAIWLRKDRRFSRLSRVYHGPRIDLLRVGSRFLISRRGEDDRFADTVLCVPAGVLRDRPTDILSEKQLARFHQTYRERIRSGPTYRADMWVELSNDHGLTASDLARNAYGSFATAWQVIRDYSLLSG